MTVQQAVEYAELKFFHMTENDGKSQFPHLLANKEGEKVVVLAKFRSREQADLAMGAIRCQFVKQVRRANVRKVSKVEPKPESPAVGTEAGAK